MKNFFLLLLGFHGSSPRKKDQFFNIHQPSMYFFDLTACGQKIQGRGGSSVGSVLANGYPTDLLKVSMQ